MKKPLWIGFLTGIIALIYFNPNSAQNNPGLAVQEEIPSVRMQGLLLKQKVAGNAAFAPEEGNAVETQELGVSEGLSKEIEKVRAVMPTRDELTRLPIEEVHGTPEKLIEVGAALGDLEEYLVRRPEEFRSATPFLSECVVQGNAPVSVRALCLHSLKKNPGAWAPGVSARLENLPDSVLEVESKI